MTKVETLKNRVQRGFTLIELLVVIAIIGILSAVVLASLSNSRGKARIANAQQTMSSINALAISCMTTLAGADGSIAIPAENGTGGGGFVCAGATVGDRYVQLPGDFVYCDGTNGGVCGDEQSSSVANSGTYILFAESDQDDVQIRCTPSGCVSAADAD